jgi:hypothetical protein
VLKYLLMVGAVILWTAPAWAQIGVGGGCGDGPWDACYVTDIPTENATEDIDASTADIDSQAQTIVGIEQQNIMPGLAGGFDWSQTLQGDLEQQVSSAGGMPLTIPAISAYPTYWPGYSQASYNQNPPPGSPEANTATTLGTLQGALNAAADQQQSQAAEASRLTELEGDAGRADGNLQVQEVANEIALFKAQEEIKERNATNGALNALLVAQSNQLNQRAQDDLESLVIGGANFSWDATLNPNPPEPQIPTPGGE